jgi:hypothetical protein
METRTNTQTRLAELMANEALSSHGTQSLEYVTANGLNGVEKEDMA